jgi:DNA-binding GntR family transcriptional regulator
MLAVRLAVPRLDEAGRARLERLVERMARCAARDDVGGFFEANGEFHWSIVEASGNSRLKDTYRQLIEQMGRYRTRSLKLRGSLKRSIAEHRTILRAIRAGDADRAAHLVSEHIRVPQRRLESTPEEELIELGVPAVSP